MEGTQDTAGDLAERIRRFAEPLAEAHEISFCCEVSHAVTDLALSKIEKRNLLLIAKEAINNCFKYAAGSELEVSIAAGTGHKLILRVSDNGAGFDMSNQSTGYGLKTMKYRADRIGYLIDLQSAPGKGTTVTARKK